MKARYYIPAIILFCIGLSMALVSSETPSIAPVKSGDMAILKQTCGSCSYVNVSVYYPNGSIAISNVGMSSDGGGRWTYSFSDTTQIGRYDYPTCGDIDGTHTCSSIEGIPYFEVTYTGEQITSQQTYIYIAALIFLTLLILGIGYIITILPSQDSRSESGEIMEIVQLKHLRKVLGMIIWALGLSIIFIISNLGIAYLPNAMIGNFFFVLWRICFYITLVGLPIYLCYIVYRFVQDQEFKKILDRGGDVNRI